MLRIEQRILELEDWLQQNGNESMSALGSAAFETKGKEISKILIELSYLMEEVPP